MVHRVGLAWALGSAIGHSAADALRKAANTAGASSVQLVAAIELTNLVLSASALAWVGWPTAAELRGPASTLATYALGSGLLKAGTGVLYQQALKLSPLSLTVPYLAFTPALLLGVSFVLVGEVPTAQGAAGVLVLTLAGFLLNSHNASEDDHAHKLKVGDEEETGASEPAPACVEPATGAVGGAVRSRLASFVHAIGVWGMAPGSMLMLLVACIWSVSSSWDKLGVSSAPSHLSFIVAQRMVMAVPLTAGALWDGPKRFVGYLASNPVLLVCISIAELGTVGSYLKSLDYLLVSYAIAGKRSGILFSVAAGALFFGEDISKRLPYVVLMIGGMMLVLFSSEDLH